MNKLILVMSLLCLGSISATPSRAEVKINYIPAENCVDFPTGVKFSGIVPNGLIVSWNDYGPGYQYQVGYREKGTQIWKTSPIIYAPNTLCAVTQLKSFTDYEIQVRAKCGSKPDFPDWSSTVLGVRTAAAPSTLCSSSKPKAPDKVNISSITQTSAVLKWESVPDAAGSVIIYGLAKEAPSKWKEIFLCREINSYEMKNLSPNEKYRVRIRTLCTECSTQSITNKKSVWAFVTDFETLKKEETPKTIVTGLIYNDKLEPVIDATVIVNGVSTKTNQTGRYVATTPVTERMIVKVDHPDYISRSVGFVSAQAETLYKDVFLKKFTQTHTFDAQKSTLLGTNGFTMYIQDSAIINEKTGKPYYGKVLVDLSAHQPGDALFGEQMPGGDFLAIGKDGKEYVMYSYGFFGCELRGENGEELNLAPEQKARVEFSVPAHQRDKMHENVPLWHFDETRTIWVEDGVTQKNGNSYSGEVSHFSFWNCDYMGPISWVEGEALTCNGTNVDGGVVYTDQIPVQINSKGTYRGWVPADMEIDIFSSTKNIEYTAPKLAPGDTAKVPKFTVNTLRAFGTIDTTGYLKIFRSGNSGAVSYSVDNGQTFQESSEFQFDKNDTTHHTCVVRDEKGCESKFIAQKFQKYSQDCGLLTDSELWQTEYAYNMESFLRGLVAGTPYYKLNISGNDYFNWIDNTHYLGCLQEIAFIDIRNTPIETIMHGMQKSPKLQSITLSNCNLSAVPNFQEWKNLSLISLKSNLITSLPAEVGEWKNIGILDLGDNQISELPKEVSEWKNIGTLDLGYNQLTELPKEVSEWKNIDGLNLGYNQLTELPKEVGEWKNIGNLGLGYNQLTELPKEVGEWKNINNLELGGNQLTELPKEVGEWKNINNLELGGNQLTELPKEVGEWKNIGTLDLGYNQLTELPAEVGQWKNVYFINLGNNLLTSLPVEIGQWKKLETLFLRNCRLTSLPPEIAQLKDNLKELTLIGNDFSPEEQAKIQSWLPYTVIEW